MDKFCTCKSYQKGVQADALYSLNAASDWYRDTLRVKDEHEGDSVVGTDDDDDDASRASVILYHEDGRPDVAHIPAPWEVHESTKQPGVYYYSNPATGTSTWTHPASKTKPKKTHSSGTPGRVPALDLLRIWDSGASQGMTDKAQISSKSSFTGDSITVHTGNGIVNSTRYEKVEVAPGISQVHVALPHTANTVSLGGINQECKVGFQWMQPLSHNIGCSFGFQAISPNDLDASSHAQISSSTSSSSSS